MSEDQVWSIEIKLARMEERQVQLYNMVETSLSKYGDVVNRVSALEHFRTKALAIAGIIGLVCSVLWDILKSRIGNGG
jgi:hypothetical protein